MSRTHTGQLAFILFGDLLFYFTGTCRSPSPPRICIGG